MPNINRVALTANLTRDPELKQTQGGTAVCQLRIACSSRIKRDGEWTEKPNYFDVVCFGALAENTNKYMEKGRMIAVDGRLDWREWEKDGQKRQAVQIIADAIQFIDTGKRDEDGSRQPVAATSAPPADDEDIPF